MPYATTLALLVSFSLACAQDVSTRPKPDTQQEALTEYQFKALHTDLQPNRPQWLQIPWRTDLLAARREAIQLGRPLFLWSMNGHPLGCT